ncbi:microviridin/marinostatin family tricyclic proteinase inhibitor [Hyalangium gracile]|uniref:microviridin/marinostatin family tricyclic proteinase inhibitor n=1 Tax=Hyalangium gracile TaxID=394092 RepID=UPI001CC9559A|nr:microviridin/marinostatin family tricyclic proteinase inhibitor [Hyalangium gracile]
MKKTAADKAQQKGKKPFFARLLEAQDLEQASGGTTFQTKKYPSDSDEFFTMKYPSDSDEDFSK